MSLIENIVEQSTEKDKAMTALKAFHRGFKTHNPPAQIADINLSEEQLEKLRGIYITLSKINHENTTVAKALANVERDMVNGYITKEQFIGSEILAIFAKGAEETNGITDRVNLLTLINLSQNMRTTPIPTINERPLHENFDEVTSIYNRIGSSEESEAAIAKARSFLKDFI